MIVSCSPKKNAEIKPEIRQEMEAFMQKDLVEYSLLEHNYTNPKIVITDIVEDQFRFDGELYGTYQLHFDYSFNDGDNMIKGSGIAVFSHDGTQSFVKGDKGVFIDKITVNGVEQDAKTSKYSLYIRKWD